ncbi:hypothetical protein [Flavobacterium tructae]|uniref:Uncharacterized protein n=1 Tax=Flavobacterium tructae TaxID=1114873 RepID=A0A1S1J3Z6_9FLAO|nr:hypothetical protein [Flavobacterium tructae]OHT44468.1 hypothetical protein BHE19_12175 [Flavobacterium tructae]OXB19396.1 hypothetical protein B0A71_12695 [Flavobacterium tructae]
MATTKKGNKKKRLKDEIYTIIRNDIPLRKKIADALIIEVSSVYEGAKRKSPRFSLPMVLEIIAKHTGKLKEELTNE